MTKQFGLKIKNDDVVTLAVNAIATPIVLGAFTIAGSLLVAGVAEFVLKI